MRDDLRGFWPRLVYALLKPCEALVDLVKDAVVRPLRQGVSAQAPDERTQSTRDGNEVRGDGREDLGLPFEADDTVWNRDPLAHWDELLRFWRSRIGVRRAYRHEDER